MLLDVIILVLRETLEAGALISVLLIVAKHTRIDLNWLWIGLVTGCVSAFVYASSFNTVSGWFEYAGQEVINSAMQIAIFISLIIISLALTFGTLRNNSLLRCSLILIVALTLTRELTEMIIFYAGYVQSYGVLLNALTSSFIGLMIGLSFGVVCYYAIDSWSPNISRVLQIIALTLIAAGMIVQAIQLLMQIDWISSTKPIWDSSWLLSESSTTGQITYAIFGYEATPTALEVSAYFVSIVLVIAGAGIKTIRDKRSGLATQ